MRGGWGRFLLYCVAVIAVVVAVFTVAPPEQRSIGDVVARVAVVGVLSYLVTFVAWPRRNRLSNPQPTLSADRRERPGPNKSRVAGTANAARPQADTPKPGPSNEATKSAPSMAPNPIGPRETETHMPEVRAERPSRGRRPSKRQSTGEMRWPAR